MVWQDKVGVCVLFDIDLSYKKYGNRSKSTLSTLKDAKNSLSRIGLKPEFVGVSSNPLFGDVSALVCICSRGEPDEYVVAASGRGSNIINAKVSGIVESIERYTAGYYFLGELSNVSNFYYKNRAKNEYDSNRILEKEIESYNKDAIKYNIQPIPKYFKQCNSLLSGKKFSYPEAYIQRCMGSAGVACGNSIPEAISCGIYELLEKTSTKRLYEVPAIKVDRIDYESVIGIDNTVDNILFGLSEIDIVPNIFYNPIKDISIIHILFDNVSIDSNNVNDYIYRFSKNCLMTGVGFNPIDALRSCLIERLQILQRTDYRTEQTQKTLSGIGNIAPEIYHDFNCYCRSDYMPIWKPERKVLEDIKVNKTISIHEIPTKKFETFNEEIDYISNILKNEQVELFYSDITLKEMGFPTVRVFPMSDKNSIFYNMLNIRRFKNSPVYNTDNNYDIHTGKFSIYNISVTGNLSDTILSLINVDRSDIEKLEYILNRIIGYLYYQMESMVWTSFCDISLFYLISIIYHIMGNYKKSVDFMNAYLSSYEYDEDGYILNYYSYLENGDDIRANNQLELLRTIIEISDDEIKSKYNNMIQFEILKDISLCDYNCGMHNICRRCPFMHNENMFGDK